MKDKNKASTKKDARSGRARRVKATGLGGGKAGSGGARSTGRSAQTPAPAQTEARLQAIFNGSRDAIGVSKAGVHVLVNPAYRALFGFPPDADLAGTSILNLIAPERRDQIKEHVAHRARGKAVPAAYETRGLRVDGSEFDMEVNASLYREGEDDLTLVILRDITERKRAAQEIAERGATLRQIMDTASVAIFLVDRSGHITHANRRMAEMFRCSMEDLVGSEYVGLVHPSERETGRGKMLALLASEIPSVDLERHYWRRDGTEFWGHLAGRRYHDVQGTEMGLIGVITDIDKRKRVEELLTESEAKYRRLYNETPVLLHSIDRNGVLVEVNAHWLRTLGYERNEVIGRKVTDFLAAASRKYAQEVIQPAFFRDGSVKDIPYQFVKKDGTVVNVLLSATAERDAAGNIVRSQAVIADITERKQAEDQLRESEEKFRALVESSYDWIWAVDENGLYTYASPRVKDILGYAAEEVVGKTPFDFMPPKERERVARDFGKVVSKKEPLVSLENINLRKDGRAVILETNGMPIFDLEGFFKGYRGIDRDITERKRTEDLLRRSEARYRMLYEGTPVMMHSIDAEGKLVSVSDYWLTTLGYSRDEVLGRRSTDFLDEQSSTYASTVVLPEFMGTGVCTDIPYTFVKKNGECISTLLSAIAERDGTGKVVRSLAVIVDITERKRTEQALRESEERYRQLFNAESDAIFLIDNETGRILMANAAAAALYGFSEEELLAKKNSDLSAEPSETRKVTEETPVIKDNAITIPLRYHCKKDGTVFPVEITGRFFTYKDRPVHIAAIRDITERKRAEEALRQSEKMLQTIIDAEPECVKLLDENANLIMMNRAGLDMLQVDTLEQVKGQCVCPMVTSEYREVFLDLTKRAFQGESGTLIFEMVGLKGRHLWMETHAVPLRNEKDEITALLAVTRDITERKKAEEALRESEERFRAITMTASDAILLMDDKEKIVYWNPAAERIFGYSADEAVGRALHEFLAPRRMHDEYRKGFARFVKTGQGPVINRSVEMVAMKKDGTEFPMEVSTSAMNIGGTWHALGIVRDVTERKQLEQEQLKGQKLESIGTLAGGIAHDFNNLLQGIFGYISMAKLTIDQREKSLAMLEQAEKALHRSVNLTSQLLTFSKGGKPVKKVLDLRPVIEDAVKFSLSGSRVSYDISFGDDLCAVDADEGQIGQVVQNIVLNAEQSMPLGGKIEIAAKNVPPARAAGLPLAAQDGLVEIVVRDQGTGIPPEHLPRIFDPYFTTKEKGSGLGLATSYSIVNNHNGMIVVSSELGKGSTFTIYLPATRAAQEQKAASGTCATGRTCRVLVMDDEQIIRVVAEELLRELGHEAEFAEHGDSAIEMYKQAKAAGKPFDVVILDLTIRGGKGGNETLRELLAIDPGVKAVVSSGYSDDEVIANYRKHGFRSFLKKPYNMGDLARVLDDVMA